jgi:hypothetical protein
VFVIKTIWDPFAMRRDALTIAQVMDSVLMECAFAMLDLPKQIALSENVYRTVASMVNVFVAFVNVKKITQVQAAIARNVQTIATIEDFVTMEPAFV